MNRPERVLLGRVVAAHGVRGDVLVKTFTEDPTDISQYGALTDARGGRPLELSVRRVTAKGLIVGIRGIEDRTAAEALTGEELWADRERFPSAEEGEFYYVDLIGLDAVDLSGAPFGKVANVVNYGAGDLLEITLLDGGQRELVPFKLDYVPNVDFEAGRLVVKWPLQFESARPEDAPGDENAAD